jgi:hypothetical protein
MKRNAFAMFIAGLLLALAGCSSNPMVGTWKLELSEEMKKNMPPGTKMPDIHMVFKADGTFEGASPSAVGAESKVKGKYKLEGTTLTMSDVEVDGKKEAEGKMETTILSADKKSFDVPNSNGMAKMVKQ